MANSLSTVSTINGNVNGLAISQNGGYSTTPQGSTAFGESVLVNTGSWQQIVSGTNFGTASTIALFNSSPSGSISLAISASGVVSSLGTVPASPNGTSYPVTSIQWNNLFTALYAQANTSASYGIFVVVSQ